MRRWARVHAAAQAVEKDCAIDGGSGARLSSASRVGSGSTAARRTATVSHSALLVRARLAAVAQPRAGGSCPAAGHACGAAAVGNMKRCTRLCSRVYSARTRTNSAFTRIAGPRDVGTDQGRDERRVWQHLQPCSNKESRACW